jgi:hypothetical protein
MTVNINGKDFNITNNLAGDICVGYNAELNNSTCKCACKDCTEKVSRRVFVDQIYIQNIPLNRFFCQRHFEVFHEAEITDVQNVISFLKEHKLLNQNSPQEQSQQPAAVSASPEINVVKNKTDQPSEIIASKSIENKPESTSVFSKMISMFLSFLAWFRNLFINGNETKNK